MHWANFILFPIVLIAIIVGSAFILAKLAQRPLEAVADGTKISDEEHRSLYPTWFFWLAIPLNVAVLLIAFALEGAFRIPEPSWAIAVNCIIAGVIGFVRCLKLTKEAAPGPFKRVTFWGTVGNAIMTAMGIALLALTLARLASTG